MIGKGYSWIEAQCLRGKVEEKHRMRRLMVSNYDADPILMVSLEPHRLCPKLRRREDAQLIDCLYQTAESQHQMRVTAKAWKWH